MTDPLFMQTRSASADGTVHSTPAERVSAPARGLVYQASQIVTAMEPDEEIGPQDVLTILGDEIELTIHGCTQGDKIRERLNYLGLTEPPAQYQVIVTVVRLGAIDA